MKNEEALRAINRDDRLVEGILFKVSNEMNNVAYVMRNVPLSDLLFLSLEVKCSETDQIRFGFRSNRRTARLLVYLRKPCSI